MYKVLLFLNTKQQRSELARSLLEYGEDAGLVLSVDYCRDEEHVIEKTDHELYNLILMDRSIDGIGRLFVRLRQRNPSLDGIVIYSQDQEGAWRYATKDMATYYIVEGGKMLPRRFKINGMSEVAVITRINGDFNWLFTEIIKKVLR